MTRRRYAARGRVVPLALALGLALGGCTSDPNSVAEQAKAGDQKGYISGSGAIETIPPERRGAPVTLSGPTIEGGTFDLASARGKVVVLNKWGSWCPPCVAELPELQSLWAELQGTKANVQFLGINVRESPQNGLAQAKRSGLTYPSLTDDSGVMELALQGQALATPTTLVLDPQGRIAARVSGRTTEATLSGLVDDVLAGK